MESICFTDRAVEFTQYPYPGAVIFPNGAVLYSDIESVDPACAPPEIRLRSGEVLFVPAAQRAELESAVQEHALTVSRRVDVWSLILEPFLDTEFDPDRQERTLVQLEQNGVPREEVHALRRSLQTRMLRYNSVHWEWVHLGLADALDAHVSRFFPAWVPFAHRRFKRFYARAMEIAGRGRVGL